MSDKEILFRANRYRRLLDVVKQCQNIILKIHIMIYHPLKGFSMEKSRRKKDQVASNIHGFATLKTDVTSQMLLFYSDMQKKTRFTCAMVQSLL